MKPAPVPTGPKLVLSTMTIGGLMIEFDRDEMILETKGVLLQIVEEEASLPEPEIEFKERLEECDKAELVAQKEDTLFDMRVAQYKAMGFYPITCAQAVEMLMEEPHTDKEEQSKRQNYDYLFRHNEYIVKTGTNCNWGVNEPDHYLKKEISGSWFLPPFTRQEVWRVEPVFKLDEFCVPIPTPLLTALNRMRKRGFFNTYKGFQCKDKKRAILLGCVSHLSEGCNKSENNQFFFLGMF